jgi:hypothetical protein
MCEAEFGLASSRDLAITQFRRSREIQPEKGQYRVVLMLRNLSLLAKPTNLWTTLQLSADVRNS